jgi:hypothetical protein
MLLVPILLSFIETKPRNETIVVSDSYEELSDPQTEWDGWWGARMCSAASTGGALCTRGVRQQLPMRQAS